MSRPGKTASLIVAVCILALATDVWLAPILEFAGTNNEVIEGLAGLVQILLWILAAIVFLTRRAGNAPVQASIQTLDLGQSRSAEQLSSPETCSSTPSIQVATDEEIRRYDPKFRSLQAAVERAPKSPKSASFLKTLLLLVGGTLTLAALGALTTDHLTKVLSSIRVLLDWLTR